MRPQDLQTCGYMIPQGQKIHELTVGAINYIQTVGGHRPGGKTEHADMLGAFLEDALVHIKPHRSWPEDEESAKKRKARGG